MVVNFRAREINRSVCKLAQTSILIKKTLKFKKPEKKIIFKSSKTLFNPSSKHYNYLPIISTSISI